MSVYAKTNVSEYFADFFAYWIANGQNAGKMARLQASAPQTYAYFEALEAGSWGH